MEQTRRANCLPLVSKINKLVGRFCRQKSNIRFTCYAALCNSSGEITLSARYTPWGDTLELNGTGNFAFGYFGGVMDAATGLIGACPELVEGLVMGSMEFTLSASRSKGPADRQIPDP